MALGAGTRLGHYEIRSQLGAGGRGEVYLALDTKLDRTVALKILPAELASNQQRMQRFIQEAKSASALNRPHILTIHEIGSSRRERSSITGETRFIDMEFIDGETLRCDLLFQNESGVEAKKCRRSEHDFGGVTLEDAVLGGEM